VSQAPPYQDPCPSKYQKDHRRIPNQRNSCRQLPFVASTVGACRSVRIPWEPQAGQARAGYLRGGAGMNMDRTRRLGKARVSLGLDHSELGAGSE
jgi:hypothetical protein